MATQFQLKPVRGIVTLENSRGQSLPLRDIKRWMNLNRAQFNTEKIDLLTRNPDPELLKSLAEYARLNTNLSARLSLRHDCSAQPPPPELLAEAGLLDALLTPAAPDSELFGRWLDACQAAGLGMRVQLRPPFDSGLDAKTLAARFKAAGVNAVSIVLSAAFDEPARGPAGDAEAVAAKINDLAEAIAAEDIETSIYGLPLCLVRDANAPLAANTAQFFLDHQQYDRRSYELAARLFRRRGKTAALALALLVVGRTPLENPLDKWLLGWLLLYHPWWYSLFMTMHKVTLFARLQAKAVARDAPPLAVRDSAPALPAAVMANGKQCAACSLRRVCDGETPEAGRALSGLKVTPVENRDPATVVQSGRRRHYDAIDLARLRPEQAKEELAAEAVRFMNSNTPTIVSADYYAASNTFSERMPGAVRWHSMTRTEKTSSSVASVAPPFMISYTVGGGIAELCGFTFGKYLRLVCPMLSASHEISLYAEKNGEYVFMRDGQPVTPTELNAPYCVPVRVPDWNEVCLSLWNIDGVITTQAVRVWKEPDAKIEQKPAKFSVVIFSTRFSRRLQAALQTLAHQQGVEPGDVEVIVGYVPGIDATDDVLESLRLSHPELRIKRAAFPQERVNSKGFIINESIRQATGEWVVMMDADVLVPPDFFERVEAEKDGCVFMAPDGRVMLDAETTAKVLLGNTVPWRQWKELVNSGEYRHRESEGIPIGFCQIVRNTCFDKVQYEEYEHFAVADFNFGLEMRRLFGREKRLEGMPVLHLDHGGSRWYGTRGHM